MTKKQREEIEAIYFEIRRTETRLRNIVSTEEVKWHNLNAGDRCPDSTPIADLIHEESFMLGGAQEQMRQGVKALEIAISFFDFAQKSIDELRPKK